MFYNDIFRYVYWLSKSRQVAEDLTQETFLRAWRALDSLQTLALPRLGFLLFSGGKTPNFTRRKRPLIDDIGNYSVPDTGKREPDQVLELEMLQKAMPGGTLVVVEEKEESNERFSTMLAANINW